MPDLDVRPCLSCDAPVVRAKDVDTQELVVVDAEPVDDGTVRIYSLKRHAFARRYGQPGQVPPVYREHVCPGSQPAPVADPYEDAPAAAQQHGGWRE